MRRRIAPGTAALLVALAACERSPVEPLHPVAATAPGAAVADPTPSQAAADEISGSIQSRHLPPDLPYPTIIDPRYDASGTSIDGYVHAGDAAIWTGHYLAAEALRYQVTQSSEALANAQRALDGIQGLVDVTAQAMPRNPGLLARFLWPVGWSHGAQIAEAERGHGVYNGRVGTVEHRWLGNTSRDQYSGVFFGLAIAYDAFAQITDPAVRDPKRDQIRRLVTRMLLFLLRNGWSVRMPDGSFSTTFLNRPDQQLTLLQIGRHVNPRLFGVVYQIHRAILAGSVATPITTECGDTHGSYYKFNLNHINLYNLIRLERNPATRLIYLNAFNILRSCTGGGALDPQDHQNPHFNMIERGLTANALRDADTRRFLGQWLQRPRRELDVDLRNDPRYPPPYCGPDKNCKVIPVNDRVPTDFLWQRSPYLLDFDHVNHDTVEIAGIDYLLPYWMARRYGVLAQ